MASIRPFKGIAYNPDKVRDIKGVVSPPYDVISPELQAGLYRRHPRNIVRLILGKIKPDDDASDNRYTRARKYFTSWLKEGILARDKKRALYIYSQEYEASGKRLSRTGFLGLLKLRDKRKVLPHENTLLKPKLDRLDMMRATEANLEPIFVLYEDRSHKILGILRRYCRSNSPFLEVGSDAVRNRVWRLTDTRIIKRIERLMAPKDIFIADGHHRYEVARTYYAEVTARKVSGALKANAGCMMAYFVELNERLLTILPTHRLIKDIGILGYDDVLRRLAPYFHIRQVKGIKPFLRRLNASHSAHTFGLHMPEGGFHLLALKDPKAPDRIIKNNSAAWRRLDVTVLHLFILEYVLGIRDEDDNVEFVKDAGLAAGLVDRGRYKAAFFLRPTGISEVRDIASRGERMPRKATYFYPKPLSGLIINKFR